MPVHPEVRYFIPCWKEPTMDGGGPSVHEIVYTIRGKPGHFYPLWQRPLFVFAAITNLHGTCRFQVELRLDEMDKETVIIATNLIAFDSGNDPLHVFPVSIMMKAAKLPRPGVYQLHFVVEGQSLAKATIHAR